MDIKDFKTNHGDLGDSVIRTIFIEYPKDSDTSRKITVQLESKNILLDYRWEAVTLIFEEVSDFRIREDNSTNQIVFEATYKELDNLIAFDFSNEINWSNLIEIKKSSFYIVSRKFNWSSKPY
jgi:hypothetical protein